jgi:hypothetical protein
MPSRDIGRTDSNPQNSTRAIVICMLLIAALALIWNLLGA